MNKYQLFCGVLVALASANVCAYDVIKAEDEYLVRDIVKVDGDNYIVETKKNMEFMPIDDLGKDETLVIDDDVMIGESRKNTVKANDDKNISHPRERYLSGESASKSLSKPVDEKIEIREVEIVTDDGEVFIVDEEVVAKPHVFETKDDYINAINECYDVKADELSDVISLYDTGFSGALGNVSHIMADVNHCYEQIGYAIIADYYDGSSYMMKNFDEESKKFYVSGTDVNFNPKFCGENCSVRALVDAQIAKFADFRIYLTKLLANK